MHDGSLWSWASGLDRDVPGYLASSLVLLTFTMKSMRPLRITAVLSNLAFLWYAASVHILPVLILHGVLLPLNLTRLIQIEAERTRRARPPATEQSGRCPWCPAFAWAGLVRRAAMPR